MLGNGQGFSTTQPAFGFPAGGLGPDNRLGLYIADTWKMFPNFTVNLGLRYDRDTGRTDSDLPALTYLNNLIPTWPNLGRSHSQPKSEFRAVAGNRLGSMEGRQDGHPRRYRSVLRKRDLEQRSV